MKKLFKTVIAAGAMLAMVGTANAADLEVNMYGASAQFNVWNNLADDFLTSVANCTGVTQAVSTDGKHGITEGTGCSHTDYTLPTGTITLRYSSKASWDGILSVKGEAAFDSDVCDGDTPPDGIDDNTHRRMASSVADPNTLGCYDITVGLSDVDGPSFVQSSEGAKLGPRGGNWTVRSFSGISTAGLNHWNPMVVPFAFFVNNDVTVSKCIGPEPMEPDGHKATSQWGRICWDEFETGKSEDCIGYYKCIGGECAGGVNAGEPCSSISQCPDVALSETRCERIPVDNITRLMAVMIYNGQAWYWTDFGAFFSGQEIAACLRHAGSGTHATLDWAVMRKNDWGWPLVAVENAAEPKVWFNDGSSDLMKCVNLESGGIGYSDADKMMGSSNYGNVHITMYQGAAATRTMVRNGIYDFWSAQWTFENPADANYALLHPLVEDLAQYAEGQIPPGTDDYYATKKEMVYMKSTDQEYPTYTGATTPMVP